MGSCQKILSAGVKCRTGNDLQEESKKHIPARIRLPSNQVAVDTRALTPQISLRGQLDGDIGQIRRRQREKITKRIPLWALSAPTPPRPPRQHELGTLRSSTCYPLCHTVASRDRHISHAFRFYHPPPLSCISVLCGDRSIAPMSCNQAGRPIKHEPRGAGPFNGRETATLRTWSKEPRRARRARLEKTHAYVRDPEDSSCPPLARHPLVRRRLDCPIGKEKGSWRRARWLH